LRTPDIKLKLGLEMKILIVCGSLRKESLTRVLTNVAYKYAKKNYNNVEYLDLRRTRINNFEGFEADYNEITEKTVKLVESSDVFILGCPIYNGLLGSALKNLFEFVNYKALEGRVAGFVLKSGTNISFLQVQGQLQALMNYFRVISNPRAVFATDEDFNGTKLKDVKIEERIKRLVDETIEMKKNMIKR
jgi:NAD(P)H-dependent FMN reductase